MTHFSVTFSSGTILTLTHLGDKAWTTKQSQWCRQIWFPQVPWQVQGRQHPQRESLSHVFCIGWGWYTWSVILLTRTSLLPLHRAHSGHSTLWFGDSSWQTIPSRKTQKSFWVWLPNWLQLGTWRTESLYLVEIPLPSWALGTSTLNIKYLKYQ